MWLLFVISVNFIPYWECLHTHTHCMSWVIYLKFPSTGNFCADWNLKLSFISLYIFNMLFECFISWLYMCVLKMTLGKIFFLQIFLQFLFFSVKHPNGLSLDPDECGSGVRTVRIHVQTLAACRMLIRQLKSGQVSDTYEWGPHRFYFNARTLATASHLLSLNFFILFVF
jgi:hypothetical protein